MARADRYEAETKQAEAMHQERLGQIFGVPATSAGQMLGYQAMGGVMGPEGAMFGGGGLLGGYAAKENEKIYKQRLKDEKEAKDLAETKDLMDELNEMQKSWEEQRKKQEEEAREQYRKLQSGGYFSAPGY